LPEIGAPNRGGRKVKGNFPGPEPQGGGQAEVSVRTGRALREVRKRAVVISKKKGDEETTLEDWKRGWGERKRGDRK